MLCPGRKRDWRPGWPALVLLLLAVTPEPAAGAEGARAGKPMRLSVPIMKTAEIKPGMKGYGLTVFRGIKPEKFDIEVIDVLRNAFPKHDMILIRCSHPVIEKAHIIAGMSGSPIYIDNKLIGALAYGWGFTKEPIAGVTPIEWMLEELAEPKAGKTPKMGGPRWSQPNVAETQGMGGPRLKQPNAASPRAAVPSSGSPVPGLTRLLLPMCLSGMAGLPPKAAARLRQEFEQRGLTLMDGASGSAYSENIGVESLVPGAPLGVALMRGDISLTGIGTLTHREGNRIIAFGHPMLFSGQEIAMPIVTAYIHGVLPSQWTSFKFGSPSLSVGTLTQDRYPAIAGTLGRKCPMIAVSASVYNSTNGRTETLQVEMINSRGLSPFLLWLVTARLLLLEGVAWEDFIVDYTLDMEFEKYGALHLEGMDMAWWGFMISAPGEALSRIMNNPFGPVRPKKIQLKLKTIHKRIEARIQRAWLDQLEVQPGKQLNLHIRFRPYDNESQEIIFPIRVPAHLDEGKYDLVVGGGNNWAVRLPTPPAESVKDIFTQLKRRYRPTTIVAVLKLPSVGVGFKGQLFRQLPSSVFGTLVSSSSAGISTFQDGIHFTHETSWYLTGDAQRLKIIVKQSAEEQK